MTTKEDFLNAARAFHKELKSGTLSPYTADGSTISALEHAGADKTALYLGLSSSEANMAYKQDLHEAHMRSAREGQKNPNVPTSNLEDTLSRAGYPAGKDSAENPLDFNKDKRDKALAEASKIGVEARELGLMQLTPKIDGPTLFVPSIQSNGGRTNW